MDRELSDRLEKSHRKLSFAIFKNPESLDQPKFPSNLNACESIDNGGIFSILCSSGRLEI